MDLILEDSFRLVTLLNDDNDSVHAFQDGRGRKKKKDKKNRRVHFELPTDDNGDINLASNGKNMSKVDKQVRRVHFRLPDDHGDLAPIDGHTTANATYKSDVESRFDDNNYDDFMYCRPLGEDRDGPEIMELKCEFCKKTLKCEKQFKYHMNSKKHKETFMKLWSGEKTL